MLELPGNCPEFESGETREIAARKAGFGSDRTYLRAKTVAHHATPVATGPDFNDELPDFCS